ncbi:hypothetical protein B5X24_HaOG201997 [Helicoverpa armigera]|uniref:Uncharacterized protein n=1 Tax=Helicoverpa armigera TaxID=29058 RepID=A0A2W1C0H5_HELAM|nr:hypothetical protein B5X24_HaOG201997 [Helicoverpa armigera]
MCCCVCNLLCKILSLIVSLLFIVAVILLILWGVGVIFGIPRTLATSNSAKMAIIKRAQKHVDTSLSSGKYRGQ